MQVSLTPELERFIEEKLKSGDFESASDVIGSALSMWKAQEQLSAATIPPDLYTTGWEAVMTPLTYRAVGFLKRVEGVDPFDRNTNFTPFSLKV